MRNEQTKLGQMIEGAIESRDAPEIDLVPLFYLFSKEDRDAIKCGSRGVNLDEREYLFKSVGRFIVETLVDEHNAVVAWRNARVHLGNAIREAREKKGVRQTELSIDTGALQSRISQIEGGEFTVKSRATVEAIARAVGAEIPGGFWERGVVDA